MLVTNLTKVDLSNLVVTPDKGIAIDSSNLAIAIQDLPAEESIAISMSVKLRNGLAILPPRLNWQVDMDMPNGKRNNTAVTGVGSKL